ncbi:Hypothetical_protein [Hexamita inflata]|uniref:Hypothetical_protein n=1 Tax=Hexamita inflata TaxID=28002 RepID=A0AA86U6N5_9EUKA|nr:Hypothetical protein HINF_LOCUS30764 [Hexamita inflata]
MTEDSNSSESTCSNKINMYSFASNYPNTQKKFIKKSTTQLTTQNTKKIRNHTYSKFFTPKKTESYNKDDENKTRNIVTVNHDLINSKPYTSMGIYCQGSFQLFDFSNLSLVTKDIHKVSVIEGIIDLSLLKGSIQCLKLISCKVQNSWNSDFHCEELQVTSRDGDISWLQHVKCERIKWHYLFVEVNYDLLKLNYDNLVNVSFYQINCQPELASPQTVRYENQMLRYC